jgi:putative oxidoreductase
LDLFYSSMFLLFGYDKLTAFAGTAGYMGSLGLPAPSLVTALAIIIEIGAGLLMLVGYQTRLAALGLGIYVLITPRLSATPSLAIRITFSTS